MLFPEQSIRARERERKSSPPLKRTQKAFTARRERENIHADTLVREEKREIDFSF
jgi:hypothetical protein